MLENPPPVYNVPLPEINVPCDYYGSQQCNAPNGGQPQGGEGQKMYAANEAQPQGGQHQVIVVNQQMGEQCPNCHAFGTVEKTWTGLHICLLVSLVFVGGVLAIITAFTVPRKCRNCDWEDNKFTRICLGITLSFLVLSVILLVVYIVVVLHSIYG